MPCICWINKGSLQHEIYFYVKSPCIWNYLMSVMLPPHQLLTKLLLMSEANATFNYFFVSFATWRQRTLSPYFQPNLPNAYPTVHNWEKQTSSTQVDAERAREQKGTSPWTDKNPWSIVTSKLWIKAADPLRSPQCYALSFCAEQRCNCFS